MTGLLAITRERLRHSWKGGFAPAKPAYRKRDRGSLVAKRQALRRRRSITAGLSRAEQSAQTAAVPLAVGRALIVVMLLSLGLWAMIWAAVVLASSVLG